MCLSVSTLVVIKFENHIDNIICSIISIRTLQIYYEISNNLSI